jgi:hypothetical protein
MHELVGVPGNCCVSELADGRTAAGSLRVPDLAMVRAETAAGAAAGRWDGRWSRKWS